MTKAYQGKVAVASGHAGARRPGRALNTAARADGVVRAGFGVEEGTI